MTPTCLSHVKTLSNGSSNVLKKTPSKRTGSRQAVAHDMLRGMKHDAGVVILKKTGLKYGGTVYSILKERDYGVWVSGFVVRHYIHTHVGMGGVNGKDGCKHALQEMDGRAQLDHDHRNSMGRGRLRCLTRSPASLLMELRRSPRRRGSATNIRQSL